MQFTFSQHLGSAFKYWNINMYSWILWHHSFILSFLEALPLISFSSFQIGDDKWVPRMVIHPCANFSPWCRYRRFSGGGGSFDESESYVPRPCAHFALFYQRKPQKLQGKWVELAWTWIFGYSRWVTQSIKIIKNPIILLVAYVKPSH